jgi:Xaa-Pro aminopeptidase
MSDITIYQRRIAALRAALEAEGLSAALLSRPQHLFYFTGAMPGPSPAFLLILPHRVIAVASSPVQDCETITYTDYDIHNGWSITEGAAQALEKALTGHRLASKAVGLELANLPAVFLSAIRGHIADPVELSDLLWAMRRVKDADEIAQIEVNVGANDCVFRAVQAAIRPGLDELSLWAIIYQTLCDAAGGPITLEGDLGVGQRGSNPDAKPGHERLASGDALFVDAYSATAGYYADTTRVFTVGEPTAKQREIFNILTEAKAQGESQLRPGVPANVVDAAVRGVIERAGYGAYFPHHSGHAYGIFQQERPYLIPAEKMPLEAGMIVTLEPGIYIPGWGGMRLESNYVLEAQGARRLDQFPSELIVCTLS